MAFDLQIFLHFTTLWCFLSYTALLLMIKMSTLMFVLLILCSPNTRKHTVRPLKHRNIPQREEEL